MSMGFGAASSPVDIVLAVDRSGSMDGQPLADAKVAVKGFIDQMNMAGGDQAALLAFNDTALVAQPLTSDAAAIKQAVDSLVATGGTDLAEAIRDAQEELLSTRACRGQPARAGAAVGRPAWRGRRSGGRGRPGEE